MILVLKAKCIFICSSHCDREWEKSRKDHLSLSFIYDSLSIIGKCKLAFFWTTVCYIKTLKHIKTHIKTDGPWRSSLKCIGGCSERALWWRSGAAQVTAPSRHGTGWIWLSSNCAELPPELFFRAVISESCFKWPITCVLALCAPASRCWRAAPASQLAGDEKYGLGSFRMAWISRFRKQFACMKYFL